EEVHFAGSHLDKYLNELGSELAAVVASCGEAPGISADIGNNTKNNNNNYNNSNDNDKNSSNNDSPGCASLAARVAQETAELFELHGLLSPNGFARATHRYERSVWMGQSVSPWLSLGMVAVAVAVATATAKLFAASRGRLAMIFDQRSHPSPRELGATAAALCASSLPWLPARWRWCSPFSVWQLLTHGWRSAFAEAALSQARTACHALGSLFCEAEAAVQLARALELEPEAPWLSWPGRSCHSSGPVSFVAELRARVEREAAALLGRWRSFTTAAAAETFGETSSTRGSAAMLQLAFARVWEVQQELLIEALALMLAGEMTAALSLLRRLSDSSCQAVSMLRRHLRCARALLHW
ncbi:unnamed protein product, partial [Polarella glacialis]